ncbi:MAG: hypothetical protein F4Z77_02810, partial [Dehalococcoidia bacterium]|nr:hypothetical protein [Dehalococcoidia bacterium]
MCFPPGTREDIRLHGREWLKTTQGLRAPARLRKRLGMRYAPCQNGRSEPCVARGKRNRPGVRFWHQQRTCLLRCDGSATSSPKGAPVGETARYAEREAKGRARPMSERPDPTPAALYARVSSDRQDVDLSVSAQLRALRDYAEKNNYLVTREYIDEAESGRVADRPQFRRMLDEASADDAPFEEILVWKFSRFTRKREHAVAFKSMLRRRGIRVVSITEHADDSPTGKLMEAIIESVDEFYSENLAQEVARGMREAASRGFWVASRTPYGYTRVYVQDGAKKRPVLEVNPETAPVVERMFTLAEKGKGITEIARTLNDDGISNPTGRPWSKNGVHILLTNEVYTGVLQWGMGAKDGAPPVRVEDAFPAIVSKELFASVQSLMRSRAPKRAHPRRVGSSYLLSGLVKCRSCRRALTGQDSKSGKFSYYVCQSLMKRGRGSCDAPRLNARRFESLVVDQLRANVLTESNIRDLVSLVAEEMDAVASERRKQLETIESEIADVRRRLDRLYHLMETTELDISDVLPRVREHKERRGRLEQTASEARAALAERREVLDDVETITAYAEEMREFLGTSELTESKAFLHSFVKEIAVAPGAATIRYSIPMPKDSPLRGGKAEEVALAAPVLSTVKSGGP